MSRARTRWACDTSFAVAALDASHEAHVPCRAALVRRRPALAGHAAFETYSVLTRLPIPLRLTPEQASAVLGTAFPNVCWLSPEDSTSLRAELAGLRIAGGSVYDALVGRASAASVRTLLTRDRRAERTYRSLEIPYEYVE
jgi:predicted nucleic acid-binding protein